ncbi:PREDICTED: uncharacterized protein LOC104800545 isoform X2 [Tarenaya hassleriana]|uniref:uncharacterized protein LOC104800545 isoform X2 n=1 Tax=Tarenaya hassleriana TaxID=28532 RepID=UPI00053C25CB|nr:PREDICTED: uncharacterized protein LOC104800545 isoform X2 [Tarenaya hassleriana]
MAADHGAQVTYVDDEPSSGSGDDANVVDGQNRSTPSASCLRKRTRKASSGDAIVEAMLEIASASKMRAAALTKKKEDRFSISKCIKVLDEIQELDEMELMAAAASYYYLRGLSSPHPSNFPLTRCAFMKGFLEGPDDDCREMLRMDKRVFRKLSDTLRRKCLLRDTAGVMIEEQIAIFLNIVGHNQRNRVIQERFRHSGETISRHFNNVLKAVKSLSREILRPPPQATPREITGSKRFYPYFKDCIGVIDGMQIPAHVPAKEASRFQNKNGVLTQNVLAACTFDLQFIFVYPGWEGSVPDSRILGGVLNNPNQNFPRVPEGKYYLVDRGYTNVKGFIAPYPGVRYDTREFRGANSIPRSPEELFNHRHKCLSNAIMRSIDVLRTRFPILKSAPQYAFHVQRDLVIAASVLHNFIRLEDRNDWLFLGSGRDAVEDWPEQEDEEEVELMRLESTPHEHVAASLRENIALRMWDDFMNEREEW